MVFLMPTNSAAKSASLHTHFLWMDFTKRRTAASMTICTLHFMIHYKFISLTDSNLAFSPTMSATAGGGGQCTPCCQGQGILLLPHLLDLSGTSGILTCPSFLKPHFPPCPPPIGYSFPISFVGFSSPTWSSSGALRLSSRSSFLLLRSITFYLFWI